MRSLPVMRGSHQILSQLLEEQLGMQSGLISRHITKSRTMTGFPSSQTLSNTFLFFFGMQDTRVAVGMNANLEEKTSLPLTASSLIGSSGVFFRTVPTTGCRAVADAPGVLELAHGRQFVRGSSWGLAQPLSAS
ncbi:unnamed protein product [Pleuronectes platessa]|uniref:Uncharacterized protein n=1 Tax=Pleuronectes platessa TaxID=8262 RepID=A0A9N7UB62_PLEPL|nr:unnamed protein product [Pleuronectes platessa]